METKRYHFSSRRSPWARLIFLGLALSAAPVCAQSTGSASGATSPANAANSVTSPQKASASPYNTPTTGSEKPATGGSGIYNPNSGTLPPVGKAPKATTTGNVNAGGGSGSGQTPGTSSPSSP
jgi:hypothetical protein